MRFSLLGLLLMLAPASVMAEQRWVSLNQCVDELLMRWAPEKLSGVTYLTKLDNQQLWQQHNGSLEAILALRPTRVIATRFSNSTLVSRLRDYTEVTVLEQPQNWQQYQQWLTQLRELGLEKHVEQHQQQTRQLFEQLKQQPKQVLFVMPNQWSWGGNTWADEIIQRAGADNLAAGLGQGLVGIDLETIWRWQPEQVLMEGFSRPGDENNAFALANQWRHHPLFKQWLSKQQVRFIDNQTAACPVVNLAAYLEALKP